MPELAEEIPAAVGHSRVRRVRLVAEPVPPGRRPVDRRRAIARPVDECPADARTKARGKAHGEVENRGATATAAERRPRGRSARSDLLFARLAEEVPERARGASRSSPPRGERRPRAAPRTSPSRWGRGAEPARRARGRGARRRLALSLRNDDAPFAAAVTLEVTRRVANRPSEPPNARRRYSTSNTSCRTPRSPAEASMSAFSANAACISARRRAAAAARRAPRAGAVAAARRRRPRGVARRPRRARRRKRGRRMDASAPSAPSRAPSATGAHPCAVSAANAPEAASRRSAASSVAATARAVASAQNANPFSATPRSAERHSLTRDECLECVG